MEFETGLIEFDDNWKFYDDNFSFITSNSAGTQRQEQNVARSFDTLLFPTEPGDDGSSTTTNVNELYYFTELSADSLPLPGQIILACFVGLSIVKVPIKSGMLLPDPVAFIRAELYIYFHDQRFCDLNKYPHYRLYYSPCAGKKWSKCRNIWTVWKTMNLMASGVELKDKGFSEDRITFSRLVGDAVRVDFTYTTQLYLDESGGARFVNDVVRRDARDAASSRRTATVASTASVDSPNNDNNDSPSINDDKSGSERQQCRRKDRKRRKSEVSSTEKVQELNREDCSVVSGGAAAESLITSVPYITEYLSNAHLQQRNRDLQSENDSLRAQVDEMYSRIVRLEEVNARLQLPGVLPGLPTSSQESAVEHQPQPLHRMLPNVSLNMDSHGHLRPVAVTAAMSGGDQQDSQQFNQQFNQSPASESLVTTLATAATTRVTESRVFTNNQIVALYELLDNSNALTWAFFGALQGKVKRLGVIASSPVALANETQRVLSELDFRPESNNIAVIVRVCAKDQARLRDLYDATTKRWREPVQLGLNASTESGTLEIYTPDALRAMILVGVALEPLPVDHYSGDDDVQHQWVVHIVNSNSEHIREYYGENSREDNDEASSSLRTVTSSDVRWVSGLSRCRPLLVWVLLAATLIGLLYRYTSPDITAAQTFAVVPTGPVTVALTKWLRSLERSGAAAVVQLRPVVIVQNTTTNDHAASQISSSSAAAEKVDSNAQRQLMATKSFSTSNIISSSSSIISTAAGHRSFLFTLIGVRGVGRSTLLNSVAGINYFPITAYGSGGSSRLVGTTEMKVGHFAGQRLVDLSAVDCHSERMNGTVSAQLEKAFDTTTLPQVLGCVFSVGNGGRLRVSDVRSCEMVRHAYNFSGDSTIAIVNRCIGSSTSSSKKYSKGGGDDDRAVQQYQESAAEALCSDMPWLDPKRILFFAHSNLRSDAIAVSHEARVFRTQFLSVLQQSGTRRRVRVAAFETLSEQAARLERVVSGLQKVSQEEEGERILDRRNGRLIVQGAEYVREEHLKK